MLLGRALVATLLTLPVAFAVAYSQQENPDQNSTDMRVEGGPGYFTIQVAAFPDEASAERFALSLLRAREKPVWGSVEIPGRGTWVRVLLGSFATPGIARRYAKQLITRGLITEFLVKPADEMKALGRRRTTMGSSPSDSSEKRFAQPRPATTEAKPATVKAGPGMAAESRKQSTPGEGSTASLGSSAGRRDGIGRTSTAAVMLPATHRLELAATPRIDIGRIPRQDPFQAAVTYFASSAGTAREQDGGLWITGDMDEGLARLRWIAGDFSADLLSVNSAGEVRVDYSLLARSAGVRSPDDPGAALLIRELIASNEGLLLLVQLIQSPYRYRFHMGRTVTTPGGDVIVEGSINLDRNFDSRINPYRHSGRKLDRELPPNGYDSLVAINPAARWFNLYSNKLVTSGNIAFHELAEAHAKVALGLDYLKTGTRPGAHDTALEREVRLKAQRPAEDNVLTAGSNRVFKTEDEAQQFKASLRAPLGSRR